MNVLYLSHCVPNPPNKGEKIRAYHQLRALTGRHRVHLACFARNRKEVKFAEQLRSCCASVYVEVLPPYAMARALLRFAAGASINKALFASTRMQRHIVQLSQRVSLDAGIAYTLPMAPFVPADLPFLLDMVDVDSEKWFQYSALRALGCFYATEGRRMRTLETKYTAKAGATILTTAQEAALLRTFASPAHLHHIENGVDWATFRPGIVKPLPDLIGRRYVAFVGTMNYYPNVDAVCWFGREVLPILRKRMPDLEFFIVGNKPSRMVQQLASVPGVTVTGGVEDIRPYVLGSEAVVAPIRLARGIQNKVLEALALGRPVLASPAVCETFGHPLPDHIIRCDSAQDFLRSLLERDDARLRFGEAFGEDVRERFNWDRAGEELLSVLEQLVTHNASERERSQIFVGCD